ncbi:MAG TPA: hypothetical protein VNA14_11370 [Mycobacteriales bacterium]|nr:hypothetical protein [Mycobacteriales bacterium]
MTRRSAATVFLLALTLGLVAAPAAVHGQQQPGGCGEPAVPATPATPADPGAPGGGATPAQPAQPATPADPEKCPEGSQVRGAGLARTAQAGPDGIAGTADDIRPSAANTGLGGAAGNGSRFVYGTVLLAAAALALAGSFVLRGRTRRDVRS